MSNSAKPSGSRRPLPDHRAGGAKVQPAAARKPRDLGFGLGLRPQHYLDILEGDRPNVDRFKAILENYMIEGGRPLAMLERIRQRRPVVPHGVSLSIASARVHKSVERLPRHAPLAPPPPGYARSCRHRDGCRIQGSERP